MKSSSFKRFVGHALTVTLNDHAMGRNADLVKCRVHGELISVEKDYIRLRHWTVLSDDKDLAEGNQECMAIVCSAITEAWVAKFRRIK